MEKLCWLKAKNSLYTNIFINLNLLDTLENKFVSVGIANCVLQYKHNINKQKGYYINFKANNFENKLYYAVDNTSLNDLGCLNGFLDTNVDNI